MKNGSGGKLLDRRFFLGAAAGGSAVALLDYLELTEIGDASSDSAVRLLRTQISGDPSLPSFAKSASEALDEHASNWSGAPIYGRELAKLPIDQVKHLIRDDYKNNRTVYVLGWILSRTEAMILTLL